MRLISTFENQQTAERLSSFLQQEGIENKVESMGNKDWGSTDYGTLKWNIWVIDEDLLEKALKWAEEFQKDPEQPIFKRENKWTNSLLEPLGKMGEAAANTPPLSRKRIAREKGLGVITLYLLISCVLIFMYGELTTPIFRPPLPPLPLTPLFTPVINKVLMYDYPHSYEIIDRLVKAYGIEKLQNLDDLPVEGKLLLDQFYHTPYWQGFYDYLVKHLTAGSSLLPNVPWFEKIQEGEFWRVFTPALLHQNVFHLFFNMIWLLVLGKIIEDRLGFLRYLLFLILAASLSNTAQYLMSGANFIGISGVICGMLGFIWSRQRQAPWEGYTLTPGVLSFMFFFILLMVGIQAASFVMEVYWHQDFVPGIANTAHVAGLLIGYLLGRIKAFNMPTIIKP